MEDKNIPAIAWLLVSRSVTGGKDYRVMVVNDLVVVGWGSINASTRQYKVERHQSPQAAQRWAAEQTGAKADKGYALVIEPRAFAVDESEYATLSRSVGSRGAMPLADRLIHRARSEKGKAV